jgi:hypothetical protein
MSLDEVFRKADQLTREGVREASLQAQERTDRASEYLRAKRAFVEDFTS